MDIIGVTFNGGVTVSTSTIVGKLYAWGYNEIYGQLGLGNLVSRSEPTQVGSRVWTQVTSGKSGVSLFSGAVANDGTLWTWGNNAIGALGQGSLGGNNCSSPVQVGTLATWSKISMGNNCGFAIKTDGTLWAWGDGANGQLGLTNTDSSGSPNQVGTQTNWAQIEGTAGRSTFAVKTDGTLWSWGNNFNGQLGQNTAGSLAQRSSPVQVGSLNNWAQVAACDGQGAMAVKTDGTLWTWGRNNQGQLAQGDLINRSSPVQIGLQTNWAKVAVSIQSVMITAAIKTDGTLWTWGPGYGMLGQGTGVGVLTSPVQVGAQNNWAQVCCGRYHMLAVKTDGTLWAWGNNSKGQLGTNSLVATDSPVQVGALTEWQSADRGSLAAGWGESFAITKITGVYVYPVQLTQVTGTP